MLWIYEDKFIGLLFAGCDSSIEILEQNELYVCISRDGQTTECSSGVIDINEASCGQADFLVRNPR